MIVIYDQLNVLFSSVFYENERMQIIEMILNISMTSKNNDFRMMKEELLSLFSDEEEETVGRRRRRESRRNGERD